MSPTLTQAPASARIGDNGNPAWPILQAGEIHVWQALLDTTDAEQDVRLLSEDEIQRAARYRFTRDRLRFITGRARLRMILGGYLDRDPASLVLAFGPHGKPRLVAGEGEAPLHFNLSHSDHVALYAVSREGPVGIDIERQREITDWADIAATVFSPAELLRLRRLPVEKRMRGFIEAWTRQEAFLKATGEGLTSETPLSDPEQAGYSLHSLTPAEGYLATLASAFEVSRIAFMNWSEASATTAFSTV